MKIIKFVNFNPNNPTQAIYSSYYQNTNKIFIFQPNDCKFQLQVRATHTSHSVANSSKPWCQEDCPSILVGKDDLITAPPPTGQCTITRPTRIKVFTSITLPGDINQVDNFPKQTLHTFSSIFQPQQDPKKLQNRKIWICRFDANSCKGMKTYINVTDFNCIHMKVLK